MIDGIKVLSQSQKVEFVSSPFMITISAILVICSLLWLMFSSVLLSVDEKTIIFRKRTITFNTKKWTDKSLHVYILLNVFAFFNLFLALAQEEKIADIGETVYTVTLDKTLDIREFTERYKIIDEDNGVFTITERAHTT